MSSCCCLLPSRWHWQRRRLLLLLGHRTCLQQDPLLRLRDAALRPRGTLAQVLRCSRRLLRTRWPVLLLLRRRRASLTLARLRASPGPIRPIRLLERRRRFPSAPLGFGQRRRLASLPDHRCNLGLIPRRVHQRLLLVRRPFLRAQFLPAGSQLLGHGLWRTRSRCGRVCQLGAGRAFVSWAEQSFGSL
jgi:hypothetical protein